MPMEIAGLEVERVTSGAPARAADPVPPRHVGRELDVGPLPQLLRGARLPRLRPQPARPSRLEARGRHRPRAVRRLPRRRPRGRRIDRRPDHLRSLDGRPARAEARRAWRPAGRRGAHAGGTARDLPPLHPRAAPRLARASPRVPARPPDPPDAGRGRRAAVRADPGRRAPDRLRAARPRVRGRMAFDVAVAGVPVDAARVQCPMLVVAGREDRITPARMVRKIAQKYRAELRVYDGHAHMVLLEPGWELIAGEVASWLDKEVR